MARPLRLEMKGAFYHVLNRGVEQRSLFDDSKDYEKFLDLVGICSARFSLEVWSYVLMGNHYHLVVRPGEENLSRAMQWLGTSYAGYYNWRHHRSGGLYQGRFKGFVVEEGEYLERLVLYIHRNPVRAKMVQRLADYPWSSYLCLGYGRKCRGWLKRDEVLKLFGGDQSEFRRTVQVYSEEDDKLLEELRQGLYLGAEELLGGIKRRLGIKKNREQPQTRARRREGDLERFMNRSAKALGLSKKELDGLHRPIRGIERPHRDLLMYLAWNEGTFRLAEIGRYFNVRYTAAGNASTRVQRTLATDKHLRQEVEAIEARLQEG